jgi:hypothetical protein
MPARPSSRNPQANRAGARDGSPALATASTVGNGVVEAGLVTTCPATAVTLVPEPVSSVEPSDGDGSVSPGSVVAVGVGAPGSLVAVGVGAPGSLVAVGVGSPGSVVAVGVGSAGEVGVGQHGPGQHGGSVGFGGFVGWSGGVGGTGGEGGVGALRRVNWP